MGKAQVMNRVWEKFPQLDAEVVAEIVSAVWDAAKAEDVGASLPHHADFAPSLGRMIEIPLSVPVDDSVVALLRLPVSVTPLYELTEKLAAAYGDDLVIRTDAGIEGWLTIAQPTPATNTSALAEVLDA